MNCMVMKHRDKYIFSNFYNMLNQEIIFIFEDCSTFIKILLRKSEIRTLLLSDEQLQI
jgi:hypothetical protein